MCDCANDCPHFNVQTKDFANGFIQRFEVDVLNKGGRAGAYGVVSFGDTAKTVSGLVGVAAAQAKIDALAYTGGYTNTQDAIAECRSVLSSSLPGEKKVMLVFTDGTPTRDMNSADRDCGNHIAPGFATAGTGASDCRSGGRDYCKCAQAAQDEATAAKNTDGITIATIYVRPPAGVDSCSPSCYPAQDFLRDKIASPNQASEAEWTNINQSVGNLADQILAQLC